MIMEVYQNGQGCRMKSAKNESDVVTAN